MRGLSISVRPTALIFRGFALVSAAIAILANVTITSMHETAGATVYAWFMTFAPPVTVLAVGLLVESLVMTTLKSRGEQKRRFDADLAEYQRLKADPTLHSEWKPVFYRSSYEELIRLKAGREAILPLVDMERNVIPALVQREVMTHNTW